MCCLCAAFVVCVRICVCACLKQMGEMYKQKGQQLYSKDFVAEDNTGLENKILKNE